MIAVLLALAASVSWGVSDFLGGLSSRRVAMLSVLLISQTVGFAMLLPMAIVRAGPLLDLPGASFAIAGSVAGLIGIGALYRGMAVGSVSIVAPISATGAAVPVVFGLLQGEHATLLQATGIGLTLVGVVLAARATDHDDAAPSGGGPRMAAGVWLALLAALGFGGFFVLLHQASARDVLWAAAVQRLTGIVVVGVLSLVVRPSLAVGWARLPVLALVGALDTAANVLYAFASTVGMVSVAAVVASLFPVVTVLLARMVLRERMSRSQGTGVACALAGVACIAAQ